MCRHRRILALAELRLDLGRDRLGGEIGRGAVLRVIGGKLCLISLDEAADELFAYLTEDYSNSILCPALSR